MASYQNHRANMFLMHTLDITFQALEKLLSCKFSKYFVKISVCNQCSFMYSKFSLVDVIT